MVLSALRHPCCERGGSSQSQYTHATAHHGCIQGGLLAAHTLLAAPSCSRMCCRSCAAIGGRQPRAQCQPHRQQMVRARTSRQVLMVLRQLAKATPCLQWHKVHSAAVCTQMRVALQLCSSSSWPQPVHMCGNHQHPCTVAYDLSSRAMQLYDPAPASSTNQQATPCLQERAPSKHPPAAPAQGDALNLAVC